MNGLAPRVQDFTVGWIFAPSLELEAVTAMLEEGYETSRDTVGCILGRVSNHNVVLSCLPKGWMGTNSAAAAVTRVQSRFSALRFIVVVGIEGGVSNPEADVRLGDLIVSSLQGNSEEQCNTILERLVEAEHKVEPEV